MRIEIMLIGIVVLVIGAALVAGVLTQTTTIDSKTKQETSTPGLLPITLPTTLAGFPMVVIAGILAVLGIVVTIVGFNLF